MGRVLAFPFRLGAARLGEGLLLETISSSFYRFVIRLFRLCALGLNVLFPAFDVAICEKFRCTVQSSETQVGVSVGTVSTCTQWMRVRVRVRFTRYVHALYGIAIECGPAGPYFTS